MSEGLSASDKMALIKKAKAIHESPDFSQFFNSLCKSLFGADIMRTIWDKDHPDEISLSE